MSTSKSNEPVLLVCNLSVFTDAQREQHLVDTKHLLSCVLEIHELPDGYRLRLPNEDSMFKLVADFIRDESLCCPFFHFQLDVTPNRDAIWLSMTGREGVKQLMAEEMHIESMIASISSGKLEFIKEGS